MITNYIGIYSGLGLAQCVLVFSSSLILLGLYQVEPGHVKECALAGSKSPHVLLRHDFSWSHHISFYNRH